MTWYILPINCNWMFIKQRNNIRAMQNVKIVNAQLSKIACNIV